MCLARSVMSRTREERETVIRFDDTDDRAFLSTFSASQARRWQKAGVVLVQVAGEWRGRAPKAAVQRCRRLGPDGCVVKAKRQGRFGRSAAADVPAATAHEPTPRGESPGDEG